MATLNLGEKYRLVSDEDCWTLQKAVWISEGTKEGQELARRGLEADRGRYLKWIGFRYYPDLPDALRGHIRRHVMSSDVEGVEAIRREFEVAKAEVREALELSGLDEEWNP